MQLKGVSAETGLTRCGKSVPAFPTPTKGRRGKPSPRRATLAGCRVTVYEHLDGTLRMGYGPHQVGRYTAAGVPLEEKKSRPRRAVEKTVAAQPGKSLRDSHFPTAFIIRHTQTL